MINILVVESDAERRIKMKHKLIEKYKDVNFVSQQSEYDIVVMSYQQFHKVEIMTKKELGWMDTHGNFQ